MFRIAVCVAWAVVLLAGLSAAAAEKVVLRVPGGRLLHPADGGTLQAGSFIPGAEGNLRDGFPAESRNCRKGADGRWLVSDARDGRTPRLGGTAAEPGEPQTFQLVPVGRGPLGTPRGQIRATCWSSIRPASSRKPETPAGAVPGRPWKSTVSARCRRSCRRPCRRRSTPWPPRNWRASSTTRRGSTRSEKYVDLPDPTLKDPKRMKRHQVIGVTEE